MGAVAPGYGLYRCDCAEHPVIEGIVCIGRREQAGRVAPFGRAAERVREGDADGALACALAGSARNLCGRLGLAIERMGRGVPRWADRGRLAYIRRSVTGDPGLDFGAAVERLCNRGYSQYLVQRFANPSLLGAVPLVLLLGKALGGRRDPVVLDLGGGAGHASGLIRTYFPGFRVILADRDFAGLYLARRFQAPQAMCLCTDAEAELPLGDRAVDAVFSMDCMHYIQAKAALVRELRRVVRPGGLWTLAHLHNVLGHNPTPGMPLSPDGYARLLFGVPYRLLPERAILETFSAGRGLDLREAADEKGLRAADALSVVAGDPDVLEQAHELDPLVGDARRRLVVNPIYQVSARGDVARLTAAWPSPHLERECTVGGLVPPPTAEVTRPLLDRIAAGTLTEADDREVLPLVRSFVLVPLTELARRASRGRSGRAADRRPGWRPRRREDRLCWPA